MKIPTLTEIYDIINKMDVESLKGIIKGDISVLSDKSKSQFNELLKLADEVGWGQNGLIKALMIELEKR